MQSLPLNHLGNSLEQLNMAETWRQFLDQKGAVFRNESVARFEPSPSISPENGQTNLIPLTSMAVLRVSGPDAEAFLQSQLTTDIKALRPVSSGITAYCSPKGRLFAIFYLSKQSSDFLLVADALVLSNVAQKLRLYVLRQKVKIEIDDGLAVIGFTPNRLGKVDNMVEQLFKTATIDEPITTLVLPQWANEQTTIVLAPVNFLTKNWSYLAQLANLGGHDQWMLSQIRAGIPSITLPIQEKFIPQNLNLDLIDGVSFKKGCYPGQEIVARVHYLGRLKQRMVRATTDHYDTLPQPGESIMTDSTMSPEKVGVIVNVAECNDNLAEILTTAPVTTAVGDMFITENNVNIVVKDPFHLNAS